MWIDLSSRLPWTHSAWLVQKWNTNDLVPLKSERARKSRNTYPKLCHWHKKALFSHMHTAVCWYIGAATKLHQQTLFPNLYLISAFELSFDIPASNSFITKHIHTQPSDNRKFLFSFVSSFLEDTFFCSCFPNVITPARNPTRRDIPCGLHD